MTNHTSRVQRSIENMVDDEGNITHVKCTQCCWKKQVDGNYDQNEFIREVFGAFSAHTCDEHRIGAAFRPVNGNGVLNKAT